MSQLPTSLHDLIAHARSVGSGSTSAFDLPYKNIGDLLSKQVERYSGKPWLTFYPDESPGSPLKYTYAEFHELVLRTAGLLIAQGIHPGDSVATVSYNHADTIVQYFAAWTVGAVVVPINVGEDDKRISFILHNSDTKLAFVRDSFLDRIERVVRDSPRPPTIIPVGGKGFVLPEKSDGIDAAIAGFPASPSLDSDALVVYTSGTTGNPKGVVLSQRNLLVDAKCIAEWHGLTAGQRMMCVLPIHHVNGTVVTILTPMYYGGSLVLNQKFHSNMFFERLSRERVQIVSVVPTLLQFLIHENPDMTKYDLSHFRHIICGAGPLTVELAAAFEERFHLPIMHGYGLSETTCYSCFLPIDLPPDEHRAWLKEYGFPSIGVPIPANEMAIHDDRGRDLAESVKGEIVIRGHNVMKEYHANPEANASTFAFGWFRSGDEGFYKTDATGRKFFFITGRIKELIIRGGSNISPFEIDEILMNMPGVKAGLAVGFENDWYGEEVGAYVQPNEGSTITEEDVIRHCRKHFSFQKSPKVVLFGNEIPVTSTGKYQRGKLKHLFDEWKSVQFTDR